MSDNSMLHREDLERVVRQRAIQVGTELGQIAFKKSQRPTGEQAQQLIEREKSLVARAAELKTISSQTSILDINVVESLLRKAREHALSHAKQKMEMELKENLAHEQFESPEHKPQSMPAPR